MRKQSVQAFAELVASTNFSFLRGASPAENLVLASLLLGHQGLGIADRNTVAGVVRGWNALRELREGGALPPIKQREGSGPGEYRFEDRALSPEEAETEALRALVQERAKTFRLITGTRLASWMARRISWSIRRIASAGGGSAGC